MAIKCDECGLVAPHEKVMHEYWPGASSSAQHFCPACWRRRQKRTHRLEAQFVAFIVLLLIAGAALAPVEHGGGLGRLALMIVLVDLFATVLHEAGHAVAAKLFGHRVFVFSIGMGLELWRKRIGGTDVRVHLMPTCGYVMHGSRSLRFSRVGHFVISAAGPAVNVALAVVGYVMIDGVIFPTDEMLLAGAGTIGPMLAQADAFEAVPAPLRSVDSITLWHIVFGVNAIIAVMNLVPMSFPSRDAGTGGGYVANDGMSMLTTLLMRGKVFEQFLAQSVRYEVNDLLEREMHDEAIERARAAVDEFPRIGALRAVLAETLNRADLPGQAREALAPLLAPDADPDKATRLIATVIAARIELDDPEGDVERADRLTNEAVQELPDWPEAQIERARALVATGWVAKGAEALAAMLGALGEDEKAAAECCCHLASAELEQGDTDQAARYLELARSLDDKCRYIRRVGQAVQSRSAPSG